ncbi:hypothetical protein N7508_005103 [Penicillium antarcticum]|uniref:uncharacterized protein n=1 Tax=Penicillium antarcticum TaxID=416450 RepID=UPI002396687B|nr:uncharacterized protein N7508_005103 [Penicillium antarcticum]KAJ5306088.1 hypothetical protein N7508_005103 [Penicillium antarcticum]
MYPTRQTNSGPGSPQGHQDQAAPRNSDVTLRTPDDPVNDPRLNQSFPGLFGFDGPSTRHPSPPYFPRPALPPLPGVMGGINAAHPGYMPKFTNSLSNSDRSSYANPRTTRRRYDPALGAASREEYDRLNPYNRNNRSRDDQPPTRARSRSPDTKLTTAGAHRPQFPMPDSVEWPNQWHPGKSTGSYQTPCSEGPVSGKQLVKWESEESKDPACEFSAPCRMRPSPDGMHWRKVVSHVFGRNKASTKLFPQYVWVHYCRKHYQRARYRADQWPFTQCDLLLESLNRMESWGGVENFELILRRREQLRVENEPSVHGDELQASGGRNASKSRREPRTSLALTAPQRSRKHPTAINAPVPLWLRGLVGKSKSFTNIRETIEHVRSYLGDLRKEEREEQMSLTMSPSVTLSPRHAAGKSRKRPAKSTGFRNNQRLQASRVRFPDVEILPTFKPWVVEAALRQRSACKKVIKQESQDHEVPDEEQVVELNDAHDTVNPLVGPGVADPANTHLVRPCVLEHIPNAPVEAEAATSAAEQVRLSENRGQSRIGRAGTNSGNSDSQRRRSQRVYIESLNRVSNQGSIKKPRERKR